MVINNLPFMVDLITIIYELKNQLALNGINYLGKIQDTPDNVMIACPYHKGGQEKNASMGIKKSDGTCHCFACGTVTSLQELISYCFGHTDDHLGAFGWNWLLKNFLTVSVEDRKDVEIDFFRTNISTKSIKGGNRVNNLDNTNSNKSDFVTEDELDSYRYYHPYWTKRGITDDYIIELFDLGFDKKTNCITFPVRDKQGNCVFVARRNVYTKWFNYPKGVEKPVYGLYEIYKDLDNLGSEYDTIDFDVRFDEIFICESMIDCILLWQYGYYAVALNGTGDELQFKQLNQLPCRKFILATDNDDAGQKARKRLRKYLSRKILTEIKFPEGIKDIGECSPEQINNIKNWEEY